MRPLEQNAVYGCTQLLGYHPIPATRAGAREALHIRHQGQRERFKLLRVDSGLWMGRGTRG